MRKRLKCVLLGRVDRARVEIERGPRLRLNREDVFALSVSPAPSPGDSRKSRMSVPER